MECTYPVLRSTLRVQRCAEGLEGGDDRLGSLQEPGRAEQPRRRGRGCPALVCTTQAASLCVFICILSIQQVIYRYKRNHSKTAVKPFSPS